MEHADLRKTWESRKQCQLKRCSSEPEVAVEAQSPFSGGCPLEKCRPGSLTSRGAIDATPSANGGMSHVRGLREFSSGAKELSLAYWGARRQRSYEDARTNVDSAP